MSIKTVKTKRVLRLTIRFILVFNATYIFKAPPRLVSQAEDFHYVTSPVYLKWDQVPEYIMPLFNPSFHDIMFKKLLKNAVFHYFEEREVWPLDRQVQTQCNTSTLHTDIKGHQRHNQQRDSRCATDDKHHNFG